VLQALHISEDLMYFKGHQVAGIAMPGVVYTVAEFNELFPQTETAIKEYSSIVRAREIFDWQLMQPNLSEDELVLASPDAILNSRCLLVGKTYTASGRETPIKTSWLVAASVRDDPSLVVTQNIHGKQTHYALGKPSDAYALTYPDCTDQIVANLPDWQPPPHEPNDPSL
jgi:hypothetical protein